MEPTQHHTRTRDDELAGIRRQLEDVIGGRPAADDDVDVRAYLLDPPPTDEQLERDERRRRLVRRGSLAGAALVAVLLLVPVPGGDDVPAPLPEAAPAPVARVEAGTATDADLPQRIDVAVDEPTAARGDGGRAAVVRPSPASPTKSSSPRGSGSSPRPPGGATSPRPTLAPAAASAARPAPTPAPVPAHAPASVPAANDPEPTGGLLTPVL